jgi:hypothetical protein
MNYNHNTNNQKNSENQFTFGFVLALCFSIVGIFVGFLFPEESKKRLTFIDGWKSGMKTAIICGIILAAGICLIIGLNINNNNLNP